MIKYWNRNKLLKLCIVPSYVPYFWNNGLFFCLYLPTISFDYEEKLKNKVNIDYCLVYKNIIMILYC